MPFHTGEIHLYDRICSSNAAKYSNSLELWFLLQKTFVKSCPHFGI